MPKPEWWPTSEAEHKRRLGRAGWDAYSEEDRYFLALSLCGEVGELANLIKKQWDGRSDPPTAIEIFDELADVRILLELLAECFGVDLDYAARIKLSVLANRPVPEANVLKSTP